MGDILGWVFWLLVIVCIIPISCIAIFLSLPPWVTGPITWFGVYVGLVDFVEDKLSISVGPARVVAGLLATIAAVLVIFLGISAYVLHWDQTMLIFQSDHPVKEFLRLISD